MNAKAVDELLESSSEESQSEDDEDAWKVTEEVEKEFFKTLSQIKSKDPKIYEKNVEFFKDTIPENKVGKKSKAAPLTLREYERKIIAEKGGELSDEESSIEKNVKKQPTYVEEQEALRNSLKAVVDNDSDDESEQEWGGLFKKREKNEEEKKIEDEDYKEWLKGQKSCAPDAEVEKDMKPLRDYWTNPDLNEEDQFLRDYILNKRFIDGDEENEKGMHGQNLLEASEDEEKDEPENKISHRFEEPDQEYIKRYPRVMENSVRMKNEHRKQKREEVKERKMKEKEKKRAEIRRKQKLKRKEIEEKLEELKKLTGNDKLAFENILDQDFDLDEHDRTMERLFSEEFYSQDDPNFKPTEQDDYVGEDWNEDAEVVAEGDEYGPYEENAEDEPLNCEHPDFNMDCDYDPTQEQKKKDSRSRRRKDKHRRTTLSEAVKKEKPVFDPMMHQSFQEYVDQYYGIDCEDFIGDLPCKFKYRKTVPNSYGLTIEEILAADVKELERWCSIKRIQRLKPEFKEKGDLKVYKMKAADERLKRKILPSLYKTVAEPEETEEEKEKTAEENYDGSDTVNLNTNKNFISDKQAFTNDNVQQITKKKKHKSQTDESTRKDNIPAVSKKRKYKATDEISKKKSKKGVQISNNEKHSNPKKKFSKINKPTSESNLTQMSDARLLAYGIKPKKFRNKLKYSKEER